MKKRLISIFISLFVVLSVLFSGVGCSSGTQYIIWFDGNGGELVSGSTTQLYYNPSEIEPPIFRKQGYKFVGWDIDLTEVSSDITATAKWSNFTVTFDGNGGTYVSGDLKQKVGYGSELVAPIFTKVGYSLSWDVGDFSTIDSETTVKAVWTVKSYQLILGDGLGNKKVTYNEPIGELKAPEKEGVEFGAWMIDNEIIDKDTIWKWDEDKTAEIIWLKENEYLLRLDYNGGVVALNPNIYRQSDDTITLKNPKREGYEFLGWVDENKPSDEPKKVVQILKGTTGDQHYSARWQANTYTLNLNARGGKLEQISYVVQYDSVVGELPVPEWQGCTFVGWYLGDEQITSETIWKRVDVNQLNAMYLRDEYTITFQLWCMIQFKQDGEMVTQRVDVEVRGGQPSDRLVNGEYVLRSKLPTEVTPEDKEEYRFYGWTINGKKVDGTKFAYNNENRDMTIDQFLMMFSKGNEEEQAILYQILDTGTITLVARSNRYYTGQH